MAVPPRSAGLRTKLLLIALVCGCLFGGYQQLFSTFAAYDDEGYLMLTLDGYQRVGKLYDHVFTQYGPAYYVLQASVNHVLRLPLAHDVSRFRTLAFWTITSGLAATALRRMTGSTLVAMLAFATMFQHLDRLALEPGHPQEWCVLLLMCGWLLSTFLLTPAGTASKPIVALLGACCGTIAMIKPNLGALAAIASFLALTVLLPVSRQRTIVLSVSGTVACLLPWVLMRSQLGDATALQLSVLVSASLCMALVTSGARAREAENATNFRDVLLFVLSVAASAALFAVCALVTGTSWRGLMQGLVLQHMAFGDRAFYRSLPLPWWTGLWAAAMLVMMLAVRRGWNGMGWLRAAAGLLLLAMVIVQLCEALRPLQHGTDQRSLAMLWIAVMVPAAWSTTIGVADRNRFSAQWSALAAVLQPLGAYPVPGTQTAVGSVLLLGIAWLSVHQGLADQTQRKRVLRWMPEPQRIMAVLVLCIVTSVAVRGGVHAIRRSQYEPLALPGTDGLRLPSAEVQQWQWLVRQLQGRAETFMFRAHTRGSVYYWTRLPPPTWCNATCWPYLLNEHQQRAVVATIAAQPCVCLVDEPYAAPLPVQRSPLLRYCDQQFIPVAFGDDFHFRVAVRRSELTREGARPRFPLRHTSAAPTKK